MATRILYVRMREIVFRPPEQSGQRGDKFEVPLILGGIGSTF